MIDTLWGIKYEEATKHSHIKPVSAGSQILRDFKTDDMSPYFLSLKHVSREKSFSVTE
jgi:hypothetical protein